MIFTVFQKNLLFGYSWSTLLWYRCYYPHRSRDALSPVCGIFSEDTLSKYLPAYALPLYSFSKHRPSGPMRSISRNVRLSVRVFVRLSVCSLLRYCLNVFMPPLTKVGCPIFLEIWNPWGKVVERSGHRFEHFCLKIV